jgi:hypothetical protein
MVDTSLLDADVYLTIHNRIGSLPIDRHNQNVGDESYN